MTQLKMEVTFGFVVFFWGLLLFPFPLTPKYLIPFECFPIPFPLPVQTFFALAPALYSAFF